MHIMNTIHTQFDVTQTDLGHLFLNHFLICFDIKKRKKNSKSVLIITMYTQCAEAK